ncbi:MAG: C_GCAxxG_C_C family protein [Chloroflexi bacterium]|nr:C_GCAxxG_C_C family protein [Chloroflexota bacterium]
MGTSEGSKSPTRRYFKEGYSCGECVILALDLEKGPGREALLSAARGLGAGRGETCTAMLSGLMAIGALTPSPAPRPRPTNDLLDSFLPPGGPGASVVQNMERAREFKARFEERARVYGRGTTCAGISRIDWNRRDPNAAPAGYPPHICVALSDAAVEEVNRLVRPENSRTQAPAPHS